MSNVPRKTTDTATVTFTHQSAFNQIVEPFSYVSLSMYFVAHWLPKITPNGLKILVQLRSMGYYNAKQGVTRGDIDIEQADLAKLLGISTRTIQRAFAEDEVLAKYIQREFKVKRDKIGRIIKEHYIYVVTMDDVLIPKDKARYDLLLQGPDKPSDEHNPSGNEDKNTLTAPLDLPNGQNVTSVDAPMRQSDASAGHSVTPMRQNVVPMRQNVASYNKVNLTLPTKEDTPNTPGAASEFSASLFEEPSPEPERAPVPTWKLLPETERKPWQEQARRELVAIHAGSGITPKPKLIEVRARNLYEVSLKG